MQMSKTGAGDGAKTNQEKIAELHALRQALFGPLPLQGSAFSQWAEFDEDLAIKVSEFFVGGLYQRTVLTQRERELCAIAALTAIRAEHELKAHVKAALNVGATPQEVGEVIFQMITYAGMPAFVEGLKAARDVLVERGDWKR
jgi:4-carboxymuconolactone decarboxylase